LRRTILVGAFLAGACVLSPWAISGEKGGLPKAKAIELTDTPKTQESATTVNFAKAFGLGFDSLNTLGTRIEAARKQADPVSLAGAANELAVAEQVSGKKASLTSDTLMKEAAELAKTRHHSSELKAVSLMAHGNEAIAKDLTTAAAIADKKEKELIAEAKEGGKTRGIMGTLHADSRVNATVFVYVDGRFVGSMGPFGDIYPYLGQTAWETTHLFARSNDGRTWHRNISNAVNNYHWILLP
jgi:hypothetical protein